MLRPGSEALATCGRILRAACALAILTGVSVLAGWAFDVEGLKSAFPGLIAMNPLTAVCFVLSALALALLHDEAVAPNARRVRQTGLSWSPFLSIEQVLFRQAIAVSDALPTGMAPNTEFNSAPWPWPCSRFAPAGGDASTPRSCWR